QKALANGSQNHLVHYYYAYILSRDGMGANDYVTGYPAESAATMREHLKKAIELAPGFPESYHLLAFINLVTNESLDDSINLMKKAIALRPGRQGFSYILAQIYLRQQKFDEARKLARALSLNASEPQLRAQAESLLKRVDEISEQIARFKSQAASPPPPAPAATADPVAPVAPVAPATSLTTDNTADVIEKTETGDDTAKKPLLVRHLQFEGEKVRGMLTEMICSAKGMTIVVKTENRIFKIHTATPEHVKFISFTPDVSTAIECGKINPPKSVLVIYHASTDAKAQFDGELVAVEFEKQ
ncbi:MAG: tetratricopeptide repeat protein, partial [Blastocatellia bacterium]|nr:tetratricopeptide repeat protein [Blastocatellia bacterium]